MQTSDFFYTLPSHLVAQSPVQPRDISKCMVLNRQSRSWLHLHAFRDIVSFLHPGDLLVVNNSKVIPARAYGSRATGGLLEIFFLKEISQGCWEALLKPSKRVRPGDNIILHSFSGSPTDYSLKVIDKGEFGLHHLKFIGPEGLLPILDRVGHTPLPPYIHRKKGSPVECDDRSRYQTIFAKDQGSVAAPTAGLHFTEDLQKTLQLKGVETVEVTLHVGYGTFSPVKSEKVADHAMHKESYQISLDSAQKIQKAREEQRRVVAVGTTSLRVLESVARNNGDKVIAGAGESELFLYPPARFRVVNAMITNFHLPESTLLMLVSAFADPGGMAGTPWILEAYKEAIRENYRFYSYGDAMFIE